MAPVVGRILWADRRAPFAGARRPCEQALRERREISFFHEEPDGRLFRLRAKPLRNGLHVTVEPTSARDATTALADEIASVRAELLELRGRGDAAG
jgi:hypothetical protein